MIAALCAFDAGNPGMVSSNLALVQLLGERARELVFLNLEQNADRFGGMVKYRCDAPRRDLERADLVVGWGDFIHAIGWARFELTLQAPLYGKAREQVLSEWYDLYMLRNVELKRAVSAGSTLYTATYEEMLEPEYADALRELARKLDYLDFRDPVSISIVRALAGVDAELGCDCALLVDGEALQRQVPTSLPQGLPPKRYLVSCFGRSGLGTEQGRFAALLANTLGLGHAQISWLGDDADDLQLFASKLNLIRNAAVCVSDIYHLCVNALREGVPTLCMSPPGRADTTLDDEKKRIFFLAHGLRRHLFDSSQLAPPCSRSMMRFLAEEAAEGLRSEAYREFLVGRFRRYVDERRTGLLQQLA